MTNLFFILLLFAFMFPASVATAVSATPSAVPKISSTSANIKKIEDLKERLATKVAELRQTSRRGIYGTVTSTSITSFSVATKTKDVKIETLDAIRIVQYLKGKRTILATEDIAKGDAVAVLGEYDATLDLLKAAMVFIQGTLPQQIAGVVSARDDKEFTLTVATPEGPAVTVDIEKTTKTRAWDGSKKELIQSGFSKIKEGSRIHVSGSAVAKQDNRISANRILDLDSINQATQSADPAK